MKKIILLLICLLLLISCKEEKAIAKKVVKVEKVEVEEVYIEYIEEDDLKFLVKECNKITNIVDVGDLHEIIIDNILDTINLDESLESQEYLIEEVTYTALVEWKEEVIRSVINKNGAVLNRDDYDELVSRTSINGAIEIMNSYEKIYLRKYYK